MKKNELLAALSKIGVTPSKRFGQNFMLDGNLLKYISKEADVAPGDNVLEVGPGCGALTRLILDDGANLAAVELDKRLADYLCEQLAGRENFQLIQGDACKLDIAEMVGDAFGRDRGGDQTASIDWKCVANLPYSISSPFIAKLAALPNPPTMALFLLQKETADRFAASPGTKNYGSLSVVIQLVFKVKYLRTVAPEVFFPAPEVKSALVEFKRLPNPIPREDQQMLTQIVRTAFSQRRKKMIKALSNKYGKDRCFKAFEKLRIKENARAEELNPEEFLKLAASLVE